jgi:phage shock protein PspC (stress-responsive transcriptional regulator)
MSVEDTIRDFWATRPRRQAEDRKVGGVAAGIGRRYGIDPVLVRVAFVVATVFSGVGVLLYLLGWLLLPAEGDETSAAEALLGRGHSSMSAGLTLLLGLALIPAASVVFQDAFGVFGLAAAGAGVFLLHRSRATLGEIPVPGSSPAQDPPGTTSPGSGAGVPAGTGQPTPPAWDPLGAAPFAWDLPEPAPVPPQAPPPPRPPKSRITPITLGLALLAGGIAVVAGLSPPQVVAIALAVVGLGLVAGSLVRGGRGLLALALPLALLTWVLQVIPTDDFRVGDSRWHPATAGQVQPRYELTMGNGRLDLTGLRLTDGQTVRTSVRVGVGEARVLLPRDADAQVVCHTPMGSVDCLDRASSGMPAQADRTDTGPDGPGGGTVVVDVRSGAGNVTVERAP